MSSEWSADELAIFALYKGKCILCDGRKAVTLHEIIPKSKRPKTWNTLENRVPVCAECHDKIHKTGAKHFADVLTEIHLGKIAKYR